MEQTPPNPIRFLKGTLQCPKSGCRVGCRVKVSFATGINFSSTLQQKLHRSTDGTGIISAALSVESKILKFPQTYVFICQR